MARDIKVRHAVLAFEDGTAANYVAFSFEGDRVRDPTSLLPLEQARAILTQMEAVVGKLNYEQFALDGLPVMNQSQALKFCRELTFAIELIEEAKGRVQKTN